MRKALNNQPLSGIFCDVYLADFRQDPTESTADLDLCIKETIRGCKWKKETEEERMINLLNHATIYYDICKYIQELEPTALKYEMVLEKQRLIREIVLNTKTIKLLTEKQTVPLLTTTLCCHRCGKTHE